MFYKFENEQIMYGPYVMSADYTLVPETVNEYTYPVDGWYYFATEEEAKTFFNVPFPVLLS